MVATLIQPSFQKKDVVHERHIFHLSKKKILLKLHILIHPIFISPPTRKRGSFLFKKVD